ncbi:MAG TPA: YidB family protein, partial [Rhodopila sp.]|uniref:YidB family protein n=1 Tax=Rhodopila sp. TaxID=2480087 RepID=UPI002BAE24E7
LFDQVIGAVMGGSQDGSAPGPAALLETIVNHEGGLNGILQKFQDAGLGDVVNSWVGQGQNLPISADTVHQVLGSDMVQQLAARTGLPIDQIGDMVAQHLPQVVDGLTPNGQVEANSGSELVALGASLLKSRFGIG